MKIVLVGLESSGKTTLLHRLSPEKYPFQGSNVRGATSRIGEVKERHHQYIDTPGVRLGSELVTSKYTKKTAAAADQLWLVVRGTHFLEELTALESLFPVKEVSTVIIVTFQDKMDDGSKEVLIRFKESRGFPLCLIDTRSYHPGILEQLSDSARHWTDEEFKEIQRLPVKKAPKPKALFSHPFWGPCLALAVLMSVYALPIFIAYQVSGKAEAFVDQYVLADLESWGSGLPEYLYILALGDYGLISLGIYSFVWAFPVVLLFSMTVAITEESGLKDLITDGLDSAMRRFGLTGQDLVPIISGFGCNVVAMEATRSCNVCSRKNCISVISFGSACSYQMGATLSVFGASGNIGLIAPYIAALMAVSLIHVKIWNRSIAIPKLQQHQSFLQRPSLKTISYRTKPVIRQFLFQAMPIFLLICLIASGMEMIGGMAALSMIAAPFLALFSLPEQVAPAFIASIFRKDGILLLNGGSGSLLEYITTSQLFLAVFFCSTFTACLVTLIKIAKELSVKDALAIAGKQMATSSASVAAFALIFYFVF
ncbi:nucleoside recognition domain-containing protein [Planococcus sp. ISL-110]|uniref:nucleoside recognition domain-containing protein n=1 Tax=Planococcus sp. ISL-110 TaxID=2819167 RepID=UPI001BE6FEB1|nr:nucleoside recognition domain-containing protein [Planococcus sp. ISL-110]MBT2571510.1 50S ribosome-binding GTPase [Planococcus sp. ISL-110]